MANLYLDFGVEPKSTAPYPGQDIPDVTDFLESSLLRLRSTFRRQVQGRIKKVSYLGTDYSLSVNEDSGLEGYSYRTIWDASRDKDRDPRRDHNRIPSHEMPPFTIKGVNIKVDGRRAVDADLYTVNKQGLFSLDEPLLRLTAPGSEAPSSRMNLSGGVRTIGFRPNSSTHGSKGKVLLEFNPLDDIKTIRELSRANVPRLIRNIMDQGNRVEVHGDKLFNLNTGRGNDFVVALNQKPKFFVPEVRPGENDINQAPNCRTRYLRQEVCIYQDDPEFIGDQYYTRFFPNHSTAPFVSRSGLAPGEWEYTPPKHLHWPVVDEIGKVIGINKINWNYNSDNFSTINLGPGEDIISSDHQRENRLDQKAIVTLGEGRDRIINGNNLTITDFDVWEDQIKTDEFYLQYKYDNEINALLFSNGLRLQNIENPDLIDWFGGESAAPVLSEMDNL